MAAHPFGNILPQNPNSDSYMRFMTAVCIWPPAGTGNVLPANRRYVSYPATRSRLPWEIRIHFTIECRNSGSVTAKICLFAPPLTNATRRPSHAIHILADSKGVTVLLMRQQIYGSIALASTECAMAQSPCRHSMTAQPSALYPFSDSILCKEGFLMPESLFQIYRILDLLNIFSGRMSENLAPNHI